MPHPSVASDISQGNWSKLAGLLCSLYLNILSGDLIQNHRHLVADDDLRCIGLGPCRREHVSCLWILWRKPADNVFYWLSR